MESGLQAGGLDSEVHDAIAAGQFELHFQPIATIATGEIEALEALVRWRHPEEGLLAPALFLPAVEASASSWIFTLHVLELAAQSVRTWMAAGHTCQVAVNVSANLIDGRLAGGLVALLADLDLPARMVALEITESAIMEDPLSATHVLRELTGLGIGGIAIDDFGTGHSSLGRLRDLPIDSLKLDRSFVAELEHGADPAFVRSVIDLGHYLGLDVVAEGVENEEAWRALAHYGCDAAQGFWLCQPLPGDEVVDWLAEHDASNLARLGAVGERRRGVGRRALDRIAGAFDRAPDAMLMSDAGHRWVAINAAARALLEVPARTLIARHIDETAQDADGSELTQMLTSLANQPHLAGTCVITDGNRTRRNLHYELRRTAIPGFHVWVLRPVS